MDTTSANIIGLACAGVMLYAAYVVAVQPVQHHKQVTVRVAPAKPKTLLQRQANALHEVWRLTDAEIAAPVILWEGK